jgi:hypothetical protein
VDGQQGVERGQVPVSSTSRAQRCSEIHLQAGTSVRQAGQDPHTQDILVTAYRLLQEYTARIAEEELRHSFLNKVAAHREIIDKFSSVQHLIGEQSKSR